MVNRLLAYYYLLFLIIAADIGGPDVQELWVMDSFAFAFSMKWSQRKFINHAEPCRAMQSRLSEQKASIKRR